MDSEDIVLVLLAQVADVEARDHDANCMPWCSILTLAEGSGLGPAKTMYLVEGKPFFTRVEEHYLMVSPLPFSLFSHNF
jgi:hypothetical protein